LQQIKIDNVFWLTNSAGFETGFVSVDARRSRRGPTPAKETPMQMDFESAWSNLPTSVIFVNGN